MVQKPGSGILEWGTIYIILITEWEVLKHII